MYLNYVLSLVLSANRLTDASDEKLRFTKYLEIFPKAVSSLSCIIFPTCVTPVGRIFYPLA